MINFLESELNKKGFTTIFKSSTLLQLSIPVIDIRIMFFTADDSMIKASDIKLSKNEALIKFMGYVKYFDFSLQDELTIHKLLSYVDNVINDNLFS